MAKVNKFSEKVQKLKRTDVVSFNTDAGDMVEFKVESRSSDQIDKVNNKYEERKPRVPTKRLPVAGGKVRIVEDKDNAEYKLALAKVQKENFAEMALLFLAEDERPEGELEEQVKQILEIELAGFIPKIVNRGLEISGVIDEDIEEEIAEVKND